MKNERKELQKQYEQNHKRYQALHTLLMDNHNFHEAIELTQIYYEVSRLRFDIAVCVTKEIYNN